MLVDVCLRTVFLKDNIGIKSTLYCAKQFSGRCSDIDCVVAFFCGFESYCVISFFCVFIHKSSSLWFFIVVWTCCSYFDTFFHEYLYAILILCVCIYQNSSRLRVVKLVKIYRVLAQISYHLPILLKKSILLSALDGKFRFLMLRGVWILFLNSDQKYALDAFRFFYLIHCNR